MGSSALVSVVTGLVEVVGSVAGFSSVFSREAFAFLGEEISLSFLPEPAAVSHFFLSVRWCFSHNDSPINKFLYQYSM